MKKLIVLGVLLVLWAGLVIGWGSIREVGAHPAEISDRDSDLGTAPACAPVSVYHVLIVYADSALNAQAAAATGKVASDQPDTTPVAIKNQILAEAGVATVDLFDAESATPTLAQLTPYEEVIVFSNTGFADPTAMGNVLADYQDTGGVVVAFNFVWYGSPYGLAGRWMTGGYTPFNDAAPTNFGDSTLGAFNAVGPAAQLRMGRMLDDIQKGVGSDAERVEASAAFLRENNVSAWSDLPVWVPGHGEAAGFHRRSNARAIAAGLTFRPVATTAADTLAWWNAQDEKRRVLRAGLKAEREAQLLAKLAG